MEFERWVSAKQQELGLVLDGFTIAGSQKRRRPVEAQEPHD